VPLFAGIRSYHFDKLSARIYSNIIHSSRILWFCNIMYYLSFKVTILNIIYVLLYIYIYIYNLVHDNIPFNIANMLLSFTKNNYSIYTAVWSILQWM
jgi:hypothetical protein